MSGKDSSPFHSALNNRFGANKLSRPFNAAVMVAVAPGMRGASRRGDDDERLKKVL
jgi:hypothetical protein